MLDNICKHFGDCGGCKTQDRAYSEQLADKEATLQELFGEYWSGPIPVAASPLISHYRNKVDFNFGRKRYDEAPPKDFVRESVLGFKKRWYWPIEIHECLIGPKGVGELLASVRGWMERQQLRAFDSRTMDGFLRVLLVREAERTGERMVVLITTDGDFDKASFVEAVLSVYPADSIQRGVFRGLADVTFGEDMEVLYGKADINEKLHLATPDGDRELQFRISPFSFFQTSTLATELLYGRIRRWVNELRPRTLYDLYGGAGGIAFSCSDLVDNVISVENVESATLDGKHNAEVNDIKNVEFITEKVKNYLLYLTREEGLAPGNAVIVDPPRSGMVPKAIKRLLELQPPNILYVACQPKLFAQQVPHFLEKYELKSLEAYDLFPHTPHVEAVAALVLR